MYCITWIRAEKITPTTPLYDKTIYGPPIPAGTRILNVGFWTYESSAGFFDNIDLSIEGLFPPVHGGAILNIVNPYLWWQTDGDGLLLQFTARPKARLNFTANPPGDEQLTVSCTVVVA